MWGHGLWVCSGSMGGRNRAFPPESMSPCAQPGKNGPFQSCGMALAGLWQQAGQLSGGEGREEASGLERLCLLWAEKVGMRLGSGRARVRRAWARACTQKRGALPSGRNRTSDLRMSTAVCAVYSPPLYQLSYRRVHASGAGSSGFVQRGEVSWLEGLRSRSRGGVQ